jgi:hypothetical protein
MSNNREWYEEDDDMLEDDYDDNGIKNLRKADRAKSKRIKELEDELEGLRKFQRESTLSSVLKDKGVNPKIAAFIPSDIAGDPESIAKWLEEYGDLFGGQQNTQPKQESQVNPDVDLATLRQIDSVTNTALSPDDVNDLYSKVSNAQSAEELINLINGFQ